MEPLTTGAIALVTLLLNKTFEKTGEIIVNKAFEQGKKVITLLKHKSPDTAIAIEAVVKNQALPPEERENIGEAVLVSMIESEAQKKPEIQAAVEALATDVDAAVKVNVELAAAVAALTKTVKDQQATSQNSVPIGNTTNISGNSGGEFYIVSGPGSLTVNKHI